MKLAGVRGEALRYEQRRTQPARGDVLVLHTDAFTEARTIDGEMPGEEGLFDPLEGAGTMQSSDLKEHVLRDLGEGLADGASLVILDVL